MKEPDKFLIIDDSELDRMKLSRLLRSAFKNIEIFGASTGEKGLEFFDGNTVDVVITDYNLPKIDGIDFVKELRELQNGQFVPVIVQTGEGSENIAVESILSGANDYLVKSKINASVIKKSVHSAIRNMELQKKVYDQQEQIKQSADFKSKFLASMSHEIRTPLNAILGMIEVLSETSLNSEQGKILKTIDRAGTNLLRVVNDILDISKIEAGQIELDRISFDVRELAENIVNLLRTNAEKKNIHLHLEVEGDVPQFLLIDPHRMNQILMNLIGNAIKFTDAGSVTLCLSVCMTKKEEKQVQFKVSDTGVGIPPDNLETIFGDFFQVKDQQVKHADGTGLGLGITKHLVSLMNGQIWAESVLGKGSQFFVQIPCLENEVIVVKKERSSQLKERRRVLFVDDEVGVREALISMIDDLQLEIYEASRGEDAIKIIEENDLDLVVTDIKMAGWSGFDLLSVARKRGFSVPFIFVSGFINEKNVVGLSDSEIFGFLEKPIGKIDLVTAIEKALMAKSSSKIESRDYEKSLKDTNLEILVVDDLEDNRDLICFFLKDFPISIDLAVNGKEAIQMVEKKEYDFILMDMQMPVVDGFSAAQAIRNWEKQNKKKAMPIIALSANAIQDEIDRSLQVGCSDYLTKPIKKAVLLRKIDEVVRAS